MALSDAAKKRLIVGLADKVTGDEVAAAIDDGNGVSMGDLASTSNAKGASLIGIEDSGARYTGTTVEAALSEAATTAALASTANAKGASLVGIEDSAGLLTATTVEAALAELVKEIPLALADPGTGVAIPVTRSATVNIVTAGAETNTLAIPTFVGQILILNMDTRSGGDRVVTSAQSINQAGNTVMTFGAARDCIMLRGVKVGGALRWAVLGNDGVALS